MLKYVSFYNEFTESMYDGFVLREDGNSFDLIDPICYEWIVKKGKEAWLEQLSPRNFDKQFFAYTERILPAYWSFIKEDDWLFDFEVKETFLPKVHSIANYFEWFAGTKNSSLSEKLARAKKVSGRFLSDDLQMDLETFVRAYYRKNRIRFLLKGEIVE